MSDVVPEAADIVRGLDLASAVVFAITGALVASRKQMDIVEFMWLGVITGVGGGTLRYLLLDAPVFWIVNPTPLALCLGAAGLVVLDAATLAGNLRAIWAAPATDARLKKRLVRAVIHEVVADIDDETSEIVLLIHWVGGAHTEFRLPKRRRGQRNSTAPEIIAAVRNLAQIVSDDLIAGILNRNGLLTGHGNRWTRERVTALRSHHGIPVFRPAPEGTEPWLNLTDAAHLLGVSPKTLRIAAEAGVVEGNHPLSDGPWLFHRSELAKPQAQQIAFNSKRRAKHPAGSHADQKSLFSSTT